MPTPTALWWPIAVWAETGSGNPFPGLWSRFPRPPAVLPARRHVFVYGTLRRGEANDINRLRPPSVFLGLARVAGSLNDLGSYPGAILGGEGWVRGEVYAISSGLEQQLDLIEEIALVPSGEYVRREIEVQLPDCTLTCLVYEIARARVRAWSRIANGDWLPTPLNAAASWVAIPDAHGTPWPLFQNHESVFHDLK